MKPPSALRDIYITRLLFNLDIFINQRCWCHTPGGGHGISKPRPRHKARLDHGKEALENLKEIGL